MIINVIFFWIWIAFLASVLFSVNYEKKST